ncbi:MAG: hypothetical protein B6U95_02840 [Thermofilum sp. ex4484_82]|nr:MAG: hypothetical protein B6U95_02840 [Thermofilum sp. ex4484_82]OYT39073.1 MAG: hypothetical protein B6U96_02835 [Archaeoglobales archaeon ex4484_92]
MRNLLSRLLSFFRRPSVKTLADIRGIDTLRKFLGKKIYYNGAFVGELEKIIADKNNKSPKKIIVKTPSNKLYKLKPRLVVIENGLLKLSKKLPDLPHTAERKLVENEKIEKYSAEYLSSVETIVDEIKKLRDRILKLDEKLIDGEIDLKTFKIIRKDLEIKIQELTRKGKEPIKKLKDHLRTVYKQKMLLEREVERYKVKIMLKEVSEEEIKGRLEVLNDKIGELDTEINRVKSIIDTYEILSSETTREEFLISNEMLTQIFES